jgi:hypothetical protein
MIEKMVWFITGAGRGLGVDIAKDEPSHTHVPRPSRVRRPDDAGNSATWGAHVSDEEYGALPTKSTSLALDHLQPAGRN